MLVWVFRSSWGKTIPKKGVPAAARVRHCLHHPSGESRQLLANSSGFLPHCEEPLRQEVSQMQR